MHPFAAYLSIAVGMLAPAVHAALATACWRMSNGQVGAYFAVPCGIVTPDSPVVACCNMGSYCLSNGICLTPGENKTGFTGYYTGGCTDASYSNAACNPYCRDLYRADIIYNNASQMWSCCGTESDHITVNCDAPTKEIFSNPAPADLYTTFSVGSFAVTDAASSTSSSSTSTQTSSSQTSPSAAAATTSSSSTSPATAASSSPSSAATSQASSPGLSTGAKAGIGVGAAVGALALLAVVLLLLRRRKRLNSNLSGGGYAYEAKAPSGPSGPAGLSVPSGPWAPQELAAGQEKRRSEPFPAEQIHELS